MTMTRRLSAILFGTLMLLGTHGPVALAHGGAGEGSGLLPAYFLSTALGVAGYLLVVWEPKRRREE